MPRDPYLAQLEEERRNDPDFARKSKRWERERASRSTTPVLDGMVAWDRWSDRPSQLSVNIVPWLGAAMLIAGAIWLSQQHQAIAAYNAEREGVVRPRTEEDEREWREAHGYRQHRSTRRRAGTPESLMIVGSVTMIYGFWRKLKYSKDRYLEQVAPGQPQPVEQQTSSDPFLDQLRNSDANDPSIRS